MNRPIRVLVVDDSILMRRMIARLLTEAGMEVVGTAQDGVKGLEMAIGLRPDVVTLDVEMPRMNGLEMLRHLMQTCPLPCVMLSTMTQDQAPVAIEALSLGAVDVLGKPGGGALPNLHEVADQLVQKVRAAASVRLFPRGDGERKVRRAVHNREFFSRRAPGRGIVVIGSSTGGPAALSRMLPELAAEFPLPVVLVQHMPTGFTESFAARLDGLTSLRVGEAREGEEPRPGEVWVAPGGVHLLIGKDRRFVLSRSEPHLGVRPAVDITLESAAEVWGRRVVAAILTGMGMDGARGARRVKRAGGRIIAQDEESSVVYGMPRAVIEMNLADYIAGLDRMPALLLEVAHQVSKGDGP